MGTAGGSWPMNETAARSVQEAGRFALIGLLVASVFALDSLTPRGIPAWILYLVPLVLTSHVSSLWAPSISAGCCAGLTVLAYFLSPDLIEMPPWIPLVNRLVGVGIFSLVAYAIVQQKQMTHELVKTTRLEVEHEALKLRERLLAKNAESLQDLYDNAPCGYHSLDPDGLIIEMNQTELDWLGYARRDVVGK